LATEAQTAFISYSPDDSEFALRLAKDLKAAGANVWLDQLDIAPGQRRAHAVQDALNNCHRFLLLIPSPSSLESTDVEDEVAFALLGHKTVIPVLYRECEVPDRLRPFQNVDFRTDYDRGLKTLLKTLDLEQSPLPKPEPITVFYSYSHKDEDLRNELEAHLAALRRSGLIREWHDRKILAGQEWEREISRYLDSAQLILFLLSADFVSSGYCVDVEVKRALDRQSAGEAVVVPVILRPVVWGIIPQFKHLQALPKNALPVTEWPCHDLAFVNICEGILALVVTRGKTTSRRSFPRPRTRRRLLDAALPARVPVAKPSTLLVMIRRTDSPGLAGIVQADPDYQVSEKDVNTKPLALKFPVDKDGTSQPLDILVKIESPEFEPRSQAKTINVPPRGDSELRVFLLTPTRLGPLLVNLEVCLGDDIIAGCLLRTNGEAPQQEEVPHPQNVVSAPLSLSASANGVMLHPAQDNRITVITCPAPAASRPKLSAKSRQELRAKEWATRVALAGTLHRRSRIITWLLCSYAFLIVTTMLIFVLQTFHYRGFNLDAGLLKWLGGVAVGGTGVLLTLAFRRRSRSRR